MNLSGLVAVSGKSGLYKIIGQSKSGFVLQSLEDAAGRIVVNANARLAALDETTVYGVGEDLTLRQILLDMQASHSNVTMPDPKSDANKLRDYFNIIAPKHDTERVYASDIKKIISWYKLLEVLPLFTENDPKHSDKVVEEKVSASTETTADVKATSKDNSDEAHATEAKPKPKTNAKKKGDS